jgi:hypothetical protein
MLTGQKGEEHDEGDQQPDAPFGMSIKIPILCFGIYHMIFMSH